MTDRSRWYRIRQELRQYFIYTEDIATCTYKIVIALQFFLLREIDYLRIPISLKLIFYNMYQT